MQKKIIALAIASALTVPAMAFADVNISGQINMAIDLVNDGMASSGSSWNLNSNQSRVILKGSEDLGGGMSAIYQLDNRFDADTGTVAADGTAKTASLFTGNTFLGMQSNDFGTLRLGNIDTPYKSSTRNLDVFYDVAGDNRSSVGGSNRIGGLLGSHDLRLKNTISYTSPNMGGFSIAAASVFGNEGAASGDKKGSLYSLAAMYSANGIYATLAYDTAKAGTTGDLAALGAPDDEAKAIKLGGGYSMDAFAVNAFIEQPKSTVAATGVETKNTNIYLGGRFNLSGTDFVRAAYTKKGETKVGGTGSGDSANQIAIGYSHDMSKMTSVYATYAKTSADGTLPDPSVLSFGMKHAF